MRILLVSSNYLPKKGGVELVVHNIAKSFKSVGEVEVLTSETEPRFNLVCKPIEENIDGVSIKKVWMNLPGTITGYLAFPIRFFTSLLTLRKVIKDFNPDLIHYHFPDNSSIFLSIILKFINKPLLLSIHGNDLHIFSEKPVVKSSFRDLINKSVGIIVNSSYMKGELTKKFTNINEKISIISNGIELDIYENVHVSAKQNQIFYVGRLVHKKGVDILIKAYELSKFDGDLIIEGTGEETENLKKLASTTNKAEKIRFTDGKLSVDDKIMYMKSAVCGVIPSRIEPFGIVALEFMAAETPLIASKTGGLEDMLEDYKTCLFFENENIEDLANKIDLLTNDTQMQNTLSKNAKNEVQKYSIDQINAQYIKLYEELTK